MNHPRLLARILPAPSIATLSASAQSALSRSLRTAVNLEPSIPRPEQDQAVAEKLAALEKKTGRKPNTVWLLVDDMGFGDPGCYGGGKAIGADTPQIDRRSHRAAHRLSFYSEKAGLNPARQN
jgi:hypothetical protein